MGSEQHTHVVVNGETIQVDLAKLGTPPTRGAVPTAYLDMDGWYLLWDDGEGNDGEPIEWPFSKDHITIEEMKALGFEVVL